MMSLALNNWAQVDYNLFQRYTKLQVREVSRFFLSAKQNCSTDMVLVFNQKVLIVSIAPDKRWWYSHNSFFYFSSRPL